MNSGARRPKLDDQYFDVVVIGGGINGVAIARECARGQRRTLLLEAQDFGAGTTSRSTRIIHGGLRYLEHGEIGLVRESLLERQRLLSERSHLVHPLTFLLALPSDGQLTRNALSIRFGLWLYHALAGRRMPSRDSAPALADFERHLHAGRDWVTFSFDDAQCEFPERLVAEWLVEAIEAGASVRNYAEVLEITVRSGRAEAVIVRDRFTGEESSIRAGQIVNATGPWADRVCANARLSSRMQRMVGGVRGTHLVLDRFEGAPNNAVYSEAEDGRPIFVLPWNGDVLIGTTEVPDSGDPSDVAPTPAEAQYLLRAVQRLFPAAQIGWPQVRYSFAGVRPLPFAPGITSAAVTRKHILHDHAADDAVGLISVIGGKLTTAASLARQCARELGVNPRQLPVPLFTPAPLDEAAVAQWSRAVSANIGMSEESVRAIAEWHGPHAFSITRLAREQASFRLPLCPHTFHVVAEVVNAVSSECAVTLGDMLLRRVPVALASHWTEACTRTAAGVIAAALGWSERETLEQVEHFEAERSRFLRTLESLGSDSSRVLSPAEHAA